MFYEFKFPGLGRGGEVILGTRAEVVYADDGVSFIKEVFAEVWAYEASTSGYYHLHEKRPSLGGMIRLLPIRTSREHIFFILCGAEPTRSAVWEQKTLDRINHSLTPVQAKINQDGGGWLWVYVGTFVF